MANQSSDGSLVPLPRIPRILPTCPKCPVDEGAFRTWLPGETCRGCGARNDGTGQLNAVGFRKGDCVGAILALRGALHELRELLCWSIPRRRNEPDYHPDELRHLKSSYEKVVLVATATQAWGFYHCLDGLAFDIGDSPASASVRTGRLLVGARDDVPNHFPPTLHRLIIWLTFELRKLIVLKSEKDAVVEELDRAKKSLDSLAERRPWTRNAPFLSASTQMPRPQLPNGFDALSATAQLNYLIELLDGFFDTLESYGKTNNGDYQFRTENHAWQLRECWLTRIAPTAMSVRRCLVDDTRGAVVALRDRLMSFAWDRVFDVPMPELAFLSSVVVDLRDDHRYFSLWLKRLQSPTLQMGLWQTTGSDAE